MGRGAMALQRAGAVGSGRLASGDFAFVVVRRTWCCE